MPDTLDPQRMPRHIAIIMDGNGRWARKRGMPRVFGHRSAVNNVREIAEECARLKIEVLTLYALSTENWLRPKQEISGLMSLLRTFVRRELEAMMKNDIRLRVVGDLNRLPKSAGEAVQKTIAETAHNRGMILNLALNYGGRSEIVRAANALLAKGAKEITEDDFAGELYTAGQPDPDLVIRTSGEMRVSNFLLWQIAYSELYVTPVLWPDFGAKELNEAIRDYQKRERRFGGIAGRATT
jgi:undecaprenyl diphosphate synthase